VIRPSLSPDQIENLGKLCSENNGAEVVFGFRTEHRQKPAYPIGDGSIWATRSTVVTLDREGRVLAETFEEIAP
jgi:hypothetical protein